MRKKNNNQGFFSRKLNFNIFICIFLVFILLTVIFSINPIMEIIQKREKIRELENELNFLRNENIELLALEKSLYKEEGIELEARRQFSMVKDGEKIYFVTVNDKEGNPNSTNLNSEAGKAESVYSNSDLWNNIKIFYNNEVKNK